MKTGIILIFFAFASTIFSGIYYFLSTRSGNSKTKSKKNKKENTSKEIQKKYARWGYYLTAIFLFAAAYYLYYLIFTHQFQVKYVYQYTSKDLSFGLLLSTFWAGQ